MRWLCGRGPVPEPPTPPTPSTWTLDRRERARLLGICGGNVDLARIAWASHTRLQFGRYLVEAGKVGRDDR